MDREEVIKLLRGGIKGVDEWNRQRGLAERIPDPTEATGSGAARTFGDLLQCVMGRKVKVDLAGADLAGADLAGADLAGADLVGADLTGANLSYADLRRANLEHARLDGAKLVYANLDEANLNAVSLRNANLKNSILIGADLIDADLSGAELVGADFTDADLSGTNLRYAELRHANLTNANLKQSDLWWANLSLAKLRGAVATSACCGLTSFADVDLSDVIGLDSIEHTAHSTIGTDTLFLSRGKIPEAFLRGCGVPDALISYLPSIIGAMSPIQFYSCFISYSREDEQFATLLRSKMREHGLRVWFAREDVKGGQKLHEQIDEAIQITDRLLLVLSEQSINSSWVQHEIRRWKDGTPGKTEKALSDQARAF